MRLLPFIALLLAPIFWQAPARAIELVVTADVTTRSPSLSTTILKIASGTTSQDPWQDSTTESAIDFGELTYLLKNGNNAGGFYSPTAYCVVVYCEPFGKPFNLMAGCTGVTDPQGHRFPLGSFGMIPVYSPTDQWKFTGGTAPQGTMPSEARLGTAGPAVPGGLVYSSESSSATPRIIQLYLTIPSLDVSGNKPYSGFVPVPLTQPPGHYAATVTLTLDMK